MLPLYLVEPSVEAGDDYDSCHWKFTAARLTELRKKLIARFGTATTVFELLVGRTP